MWKLLKKEFLLSLNPNVIIMGLLGITIMIPSYPAFVGFFYILGGLCSIMPRAAADKDLEYTSMLPIPKHDVVVSKLLLFIALELGTVLFTVPFALLRVLVLDPAIMVMGGAPVEEMESMLALEPSLSTFGFAFLVFGIYNIIFFPWFYKNPSKINAPQLVSTIITMAISIVFMIISSAFSVFSYEGLKTPAGLGIQLGLLVGGLLVGGLLTFFAAKLASKHFEKVDI